MIYPDKISHWIDDEEVLSNKFFDKINPATGQKLSVVSSGSSMEVNIAITSAVKAYETWRLTSVSARVEILKKSLKIISDRKNELAEIVALESGKSNKSAVGEVEAVIGCGSFMVESRKELEKKFLESKILGRQLKLIRSSVGPGVLIVPFNNPAASIAWKLFPALMCGDTVVIKSHEYTPYVAIWYAKVLKEAGVPLGVISVLQGSGLEVGAPLVADSRINFISFTGSVATGQTIIKNSANRLAKVLIEAGGKNPFVVCDDADLDKAADWAASSSFVDGGQRCAAASRILIFASVYEEFKNKFLEKVKTIKVGLDDDDFYGAIISQKRLESILNYVDLAKKNGAQIIHGGDRQVVAGFESGFFIQPTVVEGAGIEDGLSCSEVFGPVVSLYKVKDLDEAIMVSNSTSFGLSSAIHTADMGKADKFIAGYDGGVVRVNGPTHGSEPHVPFGGVKHSGNGWREPGILAFDFYADWKQVSIDS